MGQQQRHVVKQLPGPQPCKYGSQRSTEKLTPGHSLYQGAQGGSAAEHSICRYWGLRPMGRAALGAHRGNDVSSSMTEDNCRDVEPESILREPLIICIFFQRASNLQQIGKGKHIKSRKLGGVTS